MPRTLALIAVQRQTAASRSTRPWMRLQQGVFGGVPTTRCTKSFNKLAHTPSLRVSLGQVAGLLVGRLGCECCGVCFGVFNGGGQATLVEVTIVKKRRLRESRKAMGAIALGAIFRHTCQGYMFIIKDGFGVVVEVWWNGLGFI